MTQRSGSSRGKVPLKPFIKDFRSPMPDQELKEKYNLSPRAFLSLIKALLEKNIITNQDVLRRREMSVQRDMAKEAQFLAGLYICPNCGHPHPKPFTVCPACEVDVSDMLDNQQPLTAVSETGGHFYVEDIVGEEAELGSEVEDDETSEKQEKASEQKVTVKEDTPSRGRSAVGAITSFFSLKKKKKDK
jgi:DNA-binding Lrp family transcriptional regulator